MASKAKRNQFGEEVATRGKINRMFKYFRGNKCNIRYEYNDSLGGHQVREACTQYDRFEIESYEPKCPYNSWHESEWVVTLFRKDCEVFKQAFGSFWEFTGLGRMRYCNSGPYCHFNISPAGFWARTHNEVETENNYK